MNVQLETLGKKIQQINATSITPNLLKDFSAQINKLLSGKGSVNAAIETMNVLQKTISQINTSTANTELDLLNTKAKNMTNNLAKLTAELVELREATNKGMGGTATGGGRQSRQSPP